MALQAEENPLQLYPENLLDTSHGAELWWVAHTRSRREKALAHFLAGCNIGYYLPLIKKRQPSRQRDRFSFVPVFPGYLFFRGTFEERYRSYTSNHIARVIRVKDQHRFFQELLNVQRIVNSNIPFYPYDFLAEGQRVRVRTGPMKGIEGIIVRKKSGYRLVVTVETIARALVVELDSEMVEAA